MSLPKMHCSEQISLAEVNDIYRKLSESDIVSDLKNIKLAILDSSTVDIYIPALTVLAYREGIELKTYVPGFNQIAQEALNDNSGLYGFAPDLIILNVRAEDLCPSLVDDFSSLTSAEKMQCVDHAISQCESYLSNLLAGTRALIVVSSFVMPECDDLGLDISQEYCQRDIWSRLNYRLAQLIRKYSSVVMVDLERIVSYVGKDLWHDPKMWYLAKINGGSQIILEWAKMYMPFIREQAGMRRKCLVLDLDNTMWGGVIGEDGVDGIKLGGDYPGNIFVDFQKIIARLHKQGIMLAICSKNNLDDAKQVFDQHPDMQLSWNHFLVHAVNWNDKASNLRGVAKQLNIGLDSLVFVDDSDVECEQVRMALPQVAVYQVPKDVSRLPKLMRSIDMFATVKITEDDFLRNQMYKANQQRQNFEQSLATLDDFLQGLEMTAKVQKVNKTNFSRTVQLLQKTNQFNLTTRRHTDAFVTEICGNENWVTYAFRLEDRFGDNGQVGVAFVKKQEKTAVIDTFLLSCRVIGRTLEHEILSYIASDMYNCGCDCLIGEYVPTKKNVLVKDFYQSCGFVSAGERDGVVRFKYDLTSDKAAFARELITIINANEE